jgi:hypothetical protein
MAKHDVAHAGLFRTVAVSRSCRSSRTIRTGDKSRASQERRSLPRRARLQKNRDVTFREQLAGATTTKGLPRWVENWVLILWCTR